MTARRDGGASANMAEVTIYPAAKTSRMAMFARFLRSWSSIQEHVMAPRRARGQVGQVDVEEGIHLHAVRADVGEADPEVLRAVEGAKQRVCDKHALAVAG